MHVKVKSNQVVLFPYSFSTLQQENPTTSFDGRYELLDWFNQTEAKTLHGFELFEVIVEDWPEFDPATHHPRRADAPVLENGQWVLKWTLDEKTEQQKQDALTTA